MWLTIIKIILFMLSSIGYWECFRKKTKISIYFLPAFTVSFQITVLFFAGLLNCLRATAILIFSIGLIFLIYYTLKNHNVFLDYFNVGYIFLFLSLCIILFAVRGHVFSSYDNFSHWALVVRNMLQTDRYPNYEDTLITFQGYPLGSATFIYYFSSMVSEVESIQMFAQGYMMICFLLPVFKYAKKEKWIALIYMLLFTNFLFCYNIGINDLLVDTLLPLQGIASLLFILSECLSYDKAGKKEGVSIWCAMPMLCTTMQIKNSGIYFVVIGCIMILVKSFKVKRQLTWKELLTVLFPFLSLYFWKTHCSYVFSAASVSKHAMTAENYKQVYSSKTIGDIKLIVRGMFQFSVSGKELYYLIGFMAFTGVLVFFMKKDFMKKYACYFAASAFLYLTYMIGMLFMYLFSMPGGEATTLASSGRYRQTIFVAIYYLITVMVVQCISEIEKNYQRRVYGIVMLVGLTALWRVQSGRFVTFFTLNNPQERLWLQERLWFENAIRENSVASNQSYAVCIPSEDSGYAYYLCRYLLYSDNISVRVVTEKAQTEEFKNYNYIFFYDNGNEILNDWVEAEYPDQVGRTVITTAR